MGGGWHSPPRRGRLPSPPPSGRTQPGKEPGTEKPLHTHILINFYSWREREIHKHSGTQGPGLRAGGKSKATCHEPGRHAERARVHRAITTRQGCHAQYPSESPPPPREKATALFCRIHPRRGCSNLPRSHAFPASGFQQDELSLNTLFCLYSHSPMAIG